MTTLHLRALRDCQPRVRKGWPYEVHPYDMDSRGWNYVERIGSVPHYWINGNYYPCNAFEKIEGPK